MHLSANFCLSSAKRTASPILQVGTPRLREEELCVPPCTRLWPELSQPHEETFPCMCLPDHEARGQRDGRQERGGRLGAWEMLPLGTLGNAGGHFWLLRLSGGCFWVTDIPRDKQRPGSKGQQCRREPAVTSGGAGTPGGEGRGHEGLPSPAGGRAPSARTPWQLRDGRISW